MTLHDKLGLLADTAPRPTPDPSVWGRGRALRRRDRIVTSALVLALVVILGGLTSLVLGPPRAFSPADETVPGGAIPMNIVDLPDHVTGPLEGDLAIGQASVAFVAENGSPVVIGATDGRYHLPDLPGWTNMSNMALALSPDGEHLAWQVQRGVEDTQSKVIALLTLKSGDLTRVEVPGSSAFHVSTLAWSPNSQRLGFIADVPLPDASTLVGRVNRTTGVSSLVPGSLEEPVGYNLAIGNDGQLAVGTEDGRGFTLLKRGRWEPHLSAGTLWPAQFSPSGSWLAMLSGRGDSSATLAVETGKMAEHPFPDDTFDDRVVRPLGWLDDRLQLLAVYEVGGQDAELVITTPKVDDTSTWRRSVGSLDPAVVAYGTFAVDLIPDLDGTTNQQLTHDFGEPEWPGQRDISWLIGLGVATAIAVLMALRWLWRRRTHLL